MRSIGVLSLIVLLCVLSMAFGSIFSRSPPTAENVKQSKDKLFDSAGVPKTKAGELYHEAAAKADRLSGEMSAKKHEALAAAKRLSDNVDEAIDYTAPKVEGMVDKVKEWSDTIGEKAREAKDEALDRAGVPKTKIGELYHQGAARVDDMMGDSLNARRHEALVAAKRINDDPTNVVHNVEPLAKGIFGKLKEWTGQAQDKAVDLKDEALDRAGVPKTKIGELYHQGAAKVDDLMGDSLNARRHEALVSAKRINDDPTNVRYNMEPVASGVSGKLKEWSDQAQDRAIDMKDEALDRAGVPKTKIGELYHQGAAKVDQLLGDDLDARRHEALVAAKRFNDNPSDVRYNMEPVTSGVSDKVKEWTGRAQDRAVDMKDEALDRAGVPKTKIGELYHQGAAKVDDLMGDSLNARRHEALVSAKRFNDNPTDVRYNAEPVAHGVLGKVKEWTGLAHEKTEEAGDFASDKYYQAKDRMRESADDFGDRSQDARDFASDKYYQGKANARGVFQNAKESMREMINEHGDRFEGDHRHRGGDFDKDFATDTFHYQTSKGGSTTSSPRNVLHNARENVKDTVSQAFDRSHQQDRSFSQSGIFGKHVPSSRGNTSAEHTEKGHSHILPIVVLSLLSGGLLYLFLSHNESANKARAKLNEAKGNAKELYRAGKARAGDIFEERAQEQNKERIQNELQDSINVTDKPVQGSKYLSFPLTQHSTGLNAVNTSGLGSTINSSSGAYAAGYHEGFHDGKDIKDNRNEGLHQKPTSSNRVH
jgi:hypothetical protein